MKPNLFNKEGALNLDLVYAVIKEEYHKFPYELENMLDINCLPEAKVYNDLDVVEFQDYHWNLTLPIKGFTVADLRRWLKSYFKQKFEDHLLGYVDYDEDNGASYRRAYRKKRV